MSSSIALLSILALITTAFFGSMWVNKMVLFANMLSVLRKATRT